VSLPAIKEAFPTDLKSIDAITELVISFCIQNGTFPSFFTLSI